MAPLRKIQHLQAQDMDQNTKYDRAKADNPHAISIRPCLVRGRAARYPQIESEPSAKTSQETAGPSNMPSNEGIWSITSTDLMFDVNSQLMALSHTSCKTKKSTLIIIHEVRKALSHSIHVILSLWIVKSREARYPQ
ncbi:unnamed protein product [Arctogadus glacialis]